MAVEKKAEKKSAVRQVGERRVGRPGAAREPSASASRGAEGSGSPGRSFSAGFVSLSLSLSSATRFLAPVTGTPARLIDRAVWPPVKPRLTLQ